MRIDPALAALSSDRASQRRLSEAMQAAHRGWRAHPQVAPVLADLRLFAEGIALTQLSALSSLLTNAALAQDFVARWSRGFLRVLAGLPLAQVPMRHHHSPGFSTMQLASQRSAALSLAVYEEQALAEPARSAVFSDREQHELVIGGAGRASFHLLVDDRGNRREILSEQRSLQLGDTLALTSARETRQIDQVEGQLVILQLQRVPEIPGLTREFALPSGELQMQSSGDKLASQNELAMAVLSTMERTDSVEAIAALAGEGPDHLRWEAVRHTLAFAPQRGMDLLLGIAANPRDPLARPAAQLSQQLRQAYPELSVQGDVLCLA